MSWAPRPRPPVSFLPIPGSAAGDALLDAGESMKRLAEVKDSLDIEVKQNFIDPLQNLCDKDLKEIQVLPASLLPRPPPCPVRLPSSHTQPPTPAPPEEAGGPPPGLRLQEEAAGQDPR